MTAQPLRLLWRWCRSPLPLTACALLLANWQCQTAPHEADPPVPPADRESWGVRLEIARPGLNAVVTAGYVREWLTEWTVQGDSGVTVAYADSLGEPLARAAARRLCLRGNGSLLSLADSVSVTMADTLAIEADSLICDADARCLRVPGRCALRFPSSTNLGDSLWALLDGGRWSLARLSSSWRDTGRAETARLHARRAVGQRGSVAQVEYDSLEVEQGTLRLAAGRGVLDQGRGVLLLFDGVTGSDSGRALAAQEAECSLRDRAWVARGAVRLTADQGDTASIVTADEISSRGPAGVLTAVGRPAEWRRAAQWLAAPVLARGADANWQARGGVTYVARDCRLQAAGLTASTNGDSLAATGAVSVTSDRMRGIVRADSLRRRPGADELILSGQPRLERHGPDGAALRVGARALKLGPAARQLTGVGDFTVDVGDWSVRAARGIYDDSTQTLVLAGAVVAQQQRPDGGLSHRTEADTMVVWLHNDRPDSLVFPAAVSGTVEPAAGRVSWVQGRAGTGTFRDGRLARVVLVGDARVLHRRTDGDQVVRFGGDRAALDFSGDDLALARLDGKAELVSWSAGDADTAGTANRTEGQSMQVHFRAGAVERIQMGPGVEGSYFPP